MSGVKTNRFRLCEQTGRIPALGGEVHMSMHAEVRNVPYRVLSGGARMPAIGLGTFGSDQFGPEVVAEAVIGAAEVGYRHFDCASVYGNEKQIGQSLRTIQQRGV